jgi:N-acetylmuramoyl-L-alanine amidase
MDIPRRKFWIKVSSPSSPRVITARSPFGLRSRKPPHTSQALIHTAVIVLVLFSLLLASVPARGSRHEDLYGKARSQYYALKNSKTKKKYRSYWFKCIEAFQAVYTKYPESPRADDALFTEAMLYYDLYGYSYLNADLQEALSSFQRLVIKYPSSRLADDAQFKIGEIHLKRKEFSKAYGAFQEVVDRFPTGDMVSEARVKLRELKEYKPKPPPKRKDDHRLVTRIKHWSNPDYTRVVIYVDDEVPYGHHLLRRDPSIHKPPRLYIDIDSAKISPGLEQPIPIHDGLLTMARAGQYAPNTVRVVLDIESIKDYRIFPLNEPFRIVVDIFGVSSPEGKALAAIEEEQPVVRPSQSPVKRIVIDPGHGGRDPGAIGPSGLMEKDVVLRIAKRLKRKLKARGYEVFLTRERDVYLSLEERTAIANTRKADLFVSVHANASRKRRARGIETYILNFPSDEETMELAARENAISTKKLTDLQIILYDLMVSANLNESDRLAHHVQRSMSHSLNHGRSTRWDRGVKQGPFIVLMGARMPAILVEVSFISNRWEERRLKSRKYRDKIAAAIAEGLTTYLRETKEAYGTPSSPREVSSGMERSPERIIEGRMEKGSCLYTALKGRGISPHQIATITAHLKPLLDFKDCDPGDSFRACLDGNGELQKFTYEAHLTDIYEITRDGDGYVASKREIILDRHLARVEGKIESSLFDAIEKRGEEDHLALAFADIFGWEIDFHNDPRKGDRFALVVEKLYKDGEFVRYGNVLVAEYYAPSRVYRGFHFKEPGGREGYYDEKGNSLEKYFLRSPLKFTRITSGYSRRRRHPILGGYRPHLAIDYAAPTGTPVRAVGDGKVIFCGWNRGNGKQIKIRHGNGYVTYYNHLSRYARGIRKGRRVRQKQTIGYVGATGLATGPHLDYRMSKHGKFLDPLKMKSPPTSSVRAEHWEDFQARRDYLASQLKQTFPLTQRKGFFGTPRPLAMSEKTH